MADADANAFALGPFIDCDGGDCLFDAVAAALVDGAGMLYGLRRDRRGRWSVWRWGAYQSPSRAELVRSGIYGRDYAEGCAREDALERRHNA